MSGAGRPSLRGFRSRALARPLRNDDVKMDRHPGGAARAAGSGTHPPLPVRTRLLPVTRLLSRRYFPVPLPPIGAGTTPEAAGLRDLSRPAGASGGPRGGDFSLLLP